MSQGTTPRLPPFPRRAVLSHAPPATGISRAQLAISAHPPRSSRGQSRAHRRSGRPAGPDASGFPARPGGSTQGRARIAARRRSVRPPNSRRPPPGVPRHPSRDVALPLPSLLRVFVASSPRQTARSLGALPTPPARVHSRGCPLRQVGATRPVVFRPRGSIPTSTVSSARRLPGCCTWYRHGFAGFRPRPPPTAALVAQRGARCGAARAFPQRCLHTPRRTRFPPAHARGMRTMDPPHRVAAAVASVPFSRLRGVARALRPARSVSRCRPSSRTLSFHGLCSPSRPSPRPRPQTSRRPCGRCDSCGSSHRLRGVCPVEVLPPVAR